MSIYQKFGLKEVINACGKMTVLGGSAVSAQVAGQMADSLSHFVVMNDLMDYAGSVIAEKTGSEAGCPTCGAASGLAIAAAACVAGNNLGLIEKMPDSSGLRNEIIIQKGHAIHFGGNITQMLRIGGGIPVEVGLSNKVAAEHIQSAVNEQTAALLYVKSHHAVQKGMQGINVMLEIAHNHNLPLIIDAAAESDLKKYTAMGADMVIYSGGKALSGPTSGFIAGRLKYISACRRQFEGVGRAMKVSKEAMAGLITALENYSPDGENPQAQRAAMDEICNRLRDQQGLTCQVVQDEAGRSIYRAEIRVDEALAGISAAQLSKKLKGGNPAIYLREYYVNQGLLSIDPRPLFNGQTKTIVGKIKKYLSEAKND